ncbi:MAG: hypothetical protein LUF80_00535 [Oscillospiraceae bacterium]|nr:hypothetical protein [Oscillospiraceae bacterium]
MVDMIYQESPGKAAQIDSTWLEPSCGDGNFLAEILRRKLEFCSTDSDVRTACGSIFGIEIQADNVAECRARLVALVESQFGPVAGAEDILRRNIVQGDFLSGRTADGEKIWFLN